MSLIARLEKRSNLYGGVQAVVSGQLILHITYLPRTLARFVSAHHLPAENLCLAEVELFPLRHG